MGQQCAFSFEEANAKAKPETPLERFAAAYRLKIRPDECGDPIIPGRFGHLYFDGPRLCLMRIDAPPVHRSRLHSLVGPDGSVWLGDISPDRHGRRVQDIAVKGIRPEGHRLAIRLAGAKTRRVLSEKQGQAGLAALEKATRILWPSPARASPTLERAEGAREDV